MAQGWDDEKLGLSKCRSRPGFVDHFPPLRRGGRGGGRGVTGCAARPFRCAQDSPSIGYPVWWGCPAQFQGSRLTPPTPPSQGGERNCAFAPIHRATKDLLAKAFVSRVQSDFSPGHPAAAHQVRNEIEIARLLAERHHVATIPRSDALRRPSGQTPSRGR